MISISFLGQTLRVKKTPRCSRFFRSRSGCCFGLPWRDELWNVDGHNNKNVFGSWGSPLGGNFFRTTRTFTTEIMQRWAQETYWAPGVFGVLLIIYPLMVPNLSLEQGGPRGESFLMTIIRFVHYNSMIQISPPSVAHYCIITHSLSIYPSFQPSFRALTKV